jgi:hypothetical protein
MKIKFNSRFFALLLLVSGLVFTINQCKNVGPSDWPEPTPDVSNQLKLSVLDGETGSAIQDYNIKLILPDGTTQEYSNETGTFSVEGAMIGKYVVTASKDGYLAENMTIEVEQVTEDNVSVITQEDFYLNKKGSANLITPQGATITVNNENGSQTTVQFPNNSIADEQNVSVSLVQPPAKFGELKVLGEYAVVRGYNFSPDLTFQENARPIVSIPVDIQSVTNGNSNIYFGTYDTETNTWEKIEGVLNADRTVATFEMPHFSTWYSFTGFRLIKTGTSWSPWEFVAESEVCSAGACGTYIYTVTPNALIDELIAAGYTINLKAKSTRCVGPHYKWAQQLYARCQLITYAVYDYQGAYLGSFQVPSKKFQWMVDEWYCHDQGGGK